MRTASVARLCTIVFLAAGAAACERENRRFREISPAATPSAIAVSELRPGGTYPLQQGHSAYEENGWATNEGKRLFSSYNCVGCHANGGGGIGPPLIDAQWIYGSEPENIFATIVEGRPNGMPTFRGKIPTEHVWQLVAYVRSMSGQLPKDVSPSRSDHMNAKPAEASTPREKPVGSMPPRPAVPPR